MTTTYTYNLAGDMKHLDYSDGTPDVTLGYDSRGRLVSRADGTGDDDAELPRGDGAGGG